MSHESSSCFTHKCPKFLPEGQKSFCWRFPLRSSLLCSLPCWYFPSSHHHLPRSCYPVTTLLPSLLQEFTQLFPYYVIYLLLSMSKLGCAKQIYKTVSQWTTLFFKVYLNIQLSLSREKSSFIHYPTQQHAFLSLLWERQRNGNPDKSHFLNKP